MLIETMGLVIAEVDGSAAEFAAAEFAADEAELRRAELLVVHAGADTAGADAVLRTAMGRIHAGHPDLVTGSEIAVGDPAGMLLRRATASDLIVLGEPRPRRGQRPGGTVLAAVVGRAGCPVVVHRGSGDRQAPVLVGLLGGTEGESVVRFAMEEAARRQVPLVALGVGRASEQQERELAELLARWSKKYPDVTVTRRTRRMLDAAVTLTAAARSAGLVVVGAPSTADRPAADRPGEAVARVLAGRAACPVAVVPLGGPARHR